MKILTSHDFSIGRIHVLCQDNYITNIAFDNTVKRLEAGCVQGECAAASVFFCQLGEYLSGKRKAFDVPYILNGTDFQRRVWNALCDIPYGTTATYRVVAESIGAPRAYRAVGLANNRNPLPIIIPCHRVVGTDGSLTGYAGGLDMKRALLELEGVQD